MFSKLRAWVRASACALACAVQLALRLGALDDVVAVARIAVPARRGPARQHLGLGPARPALRCDCIQVGLASSSMSGCAPRGGSSCRFVRYFVGLAPKRDGITTWRSCAGPPGRFRTIRLHPRVGILRPAANSLNGATDVLYGGLFFVMPRKTQNQPFRTSESQIQKLGKSIINKSGSVVRLF